MSDMPSMRLRIVELPTERVGDTESTPFVFLIDRCTLTPEECDLLPEQGRSVAELAGARGCLVFAFDVELG